MIPNALFHLLTASAPTIPWPVAVICTSILLVPYTAKRALRAAESVVRLFAVFSSNPVHVERVERLAIGGRQPR